MKIQRALVSALLVASMLLGIAQIAQAKKFNHPSGFGFNFPDNWSVDKQKDVITGSSKDGATAVSFSVPPAGAGLQAIADAYGKQIRKTLKKVQTGKDINTEINGMKVILVDGLGELNGQPMNFTYGIYSNGQRYLGVFALCAKAKFPTHKETLVKILRSVTSK